MNIKGFIKLAATFTGIAAAILVTDKVVDRIIDGKQEKATENNDGSCSNDCEAETETETEETTEVTESNKTIVKAAVKAAIPGVTYEGVSGAIAFDEIGDAIRDTAFIKTANTEDGSWALVKQQKAE